MQTAANLAAALAAALPDGPWTVDPFRENDDSARWASVSRPDGARFSVHVAGAFGSRAARAHVSATLPGRNGNLGATARDWNAPDAPRISFDPDRDAAAIARDVARRFLPGFLITWAAVQDARARVAAALDVRDAAAATLDACGFPSYPGDRPEDPRRVHGWPLVTVHADGSVRFSAFSVEPWAAGAILAAVDPERVKGDPCTNQRRAARGKAWAALFALAYDPGDVGASLRDVLTDLAHAYGPDELDAAARMAREHWTVETGGLGHGGRLTRGRRRVAEGA